MANHKGPQVRDPEPGSAARRRHLGDERTRAQVRQRQHPFRLLVMLERHEYPWLTRDGLKIHAYTAGLVRILKIARARLDDHFYWLQRFGYLKNVRRQRGQVEAELVPPRVYVKPEDLQ